MTGKIKRKTQGLWSNNKMCHTCAIEILEGAEKEKGMEKLLEIVMTKNFPNILTDTKS